VDFIQQQNKQKEKKIEPEKIMLKLPESIEVLNNEPPPLDQNKLEKYNN
jgi:hypothetical protein